MQTLRFFAKKMVPEIMYNGLEVAEIVSDNPADPEFGIDRSLTVVLSNGVRLAAYLDELYIQEG